MAYGPGTYHWVNCFVYDPGVHLPLALLICPFWLADLSIFQALTHGFDDLFTIQECK